MFFNSFVKRQAELARSGPTPRGAAESCVWATGEQYSGQIGMIYTAQGFEFDYARVIIGPILSCATADPLPALSSPTIRRCAGRNKQDLEEANRLIRSTYRALLTREMRGVTLNATDPEASAYLAGSEKRCRHRAGRPWSFVIGARARSARAAAPVAVCSPPVRTSVRAHW